MTYPMVNYVWFIIVLEVNYISNIKFFRRSLSANLDRMLGYLPLMTPDGTLYLGSCLALSLKN